MSGKKGGLAHFLYGTVKGKNIVNMAMSLGAAVVILGALFKIQHYPGASAMLIIGLCTESALFALGAIEPQHLALDWTKVYPELAHHEGDEEEEEMEDVLATGETVTQKLDEMLQDAQIGPELINSLGQGLRGLKDQTEKLSNITDASVATDEYVSSVRNAAQSVGNLSDTYIRASQSIADLGVDASSSHSFGEQLSKMSQNLSDLNAAYELQLQSAQETLKNSKSMFTGVDELMSSLNDSVEDAKNYAGAMRELSSNISSLNTIYGNMLSAMNPARV
ncbi:MAG: gliding motility protein GldL [Flavobacteriales bacterium]|nr:gliding motility protein GldL [Flavobacteriales bacterium]